MNQIFLFLRNARFLCLFATMAMCFFEISTAFARSDYYEYYQPSQGTIAGTVNDDSGVPLPGANIVVDGTNKFAVTDSNGRFSVLIEPGNYVVSVSYINFAASKQPVTVKSGTTETLQIIPAKDGANMNEVVVVGYGTQKKLNLTGAVSQVTAEVLENRPAPNLTRMLQGALPNLNLKMVDGSPTRGATYNIRGITSIGSGGSALVLIDGIEGDPNLVNPNDVESVSVLKDASSAAVYGSRAAFGVVLITTKSAKKGKIRVDYSSSYSVSQRTVVPKIVTNGYEWAKNFDEAFNAWNDYNSHPISVNNIYPFSLEINVKVVGKRSMSPMVKA